MIMSYDYDGYIKVTFIDVYRSNVLERLRTVNVNLEQKREKTSH